MKILTKSAQAMAIIGMLVCSAAMAGDIVEGNGHTKEEATRNAERRAHEKARENNTCHITRVKMSECKRESDGTWTCYAAAAHHGNRCK
ncbi:hypothetical protein [Massilia glaciei]|uniref:DUF4189 domain-containing protein n=1 Tax=Massilia glaciei TaxID=1524097 RepID=A0A2U2HGY7_9BURK|nr:hypothetical protein [Massilia glaciei]PWF44657.1 hypothetical protein C7C56_019155 [Massilia glaciei]